MPFLDSHAATGKGKGKGGVFGIGKGKDANTAQREHSAFVLQKKRFVPNKRCLARGLFQSMFFFGRGGTRKGGWCYKKRCFL